MSNATIIFLLTLCIMILICIIVYQQFVFHNGTKAKIHEISSKLKELLDTDSDEKVTVFTDNKALIELATQINRMLEDRQKVKVEYRRAEMASKKMLSNISHDIKTPMTVILGYLEIMRLNGTQSNEMLQKVESTAQRVMGLITQFFTLAKLEAGDTDMPLERLNVNEACRENILDFYELLSQKNFEVEINIPDHVLYANANKDALQRIMFNLISNAIRYGGDGKYLGMFLRADQAHIYIDIVDRGRGIEKEFADSVFDRLFMMEDSRNSAMQGSATSVLGGKYPSKESSFGGLILTDDFSLVSPNYNHEIQDTVRGFYKLREELSDTTTLLPREYEYEFLSSREKSQATMDLGDEYAKLVLKDGDLEDNWNTWVEEKMAVVQPVLDQLNK